MRCDFECYMSWGEWGVRQLLDIKTVQMLQKMVNLYRNQIKFMKIDNTKTIAETYNSQPSLFNYAEALRQLKHADALLQKRKKQLRVQAVKAHKGSWMDHQLEQKQRLRQQMKAGNEKVQAELQSLRVKQMQRIEQYKKRGERFRQQSFKNREKSRLEILESKLRAKHEIRLKSIEHEEKIRNQQNQTIRRKKSLCQDVYNTRKLSRVNFQNFQQSRIIEVRKIQSRQTDDLMQKLKLRQKELNQLDESSVLSPEADKKHDQSTADITSLRKSQLPYKDSSSSYLKRRKKSISETKMDSSRHQLLILN